MRSLSLSSPNPPRGGWRYEPHPGDQDLSVTVMQVVALRAASLDIYQHFLPAYQR